MKPVVISGTRKKAIARAVIRPGSGIVRVNKLIIDAVEPRAWRLRMREPLLIAGESAQKVDIDVTVNGGGISGQADAVRLVLAKALVTYNKDKKLEKTFLDYDRQLLVADVRQRETRKPNTHGNARGKTQKSYR